MDSISEEKVKLRRRVRESRQNIAPDNRYLRDSQIRNSIMSVPDIANSQNILMYAPIDGEPDIMPLFPEFISRGASVYFPLCRGNTIEFRLTKDLSELKTSDSRFGIREPETDKPLCIY